MLRETDNDPDLRFAFGWLLFMRDRLLPQPYQRHPAGFLITDEAMPAVTCRVEDVELGERYLSGWAVPPHTRPHAPSPGSTGVIRTSGNPRWDDTAEADGPGDEGDNQLPRPIGTGENQEATTVPDSDRPKQCPPASTEAASPTTPDPFAALALFDAFRAAVEPLAAEFWATRQPLKNALAALEASSGPDPDGSAERWLAAGEQLRKVGLAAFPGEMASAEPADAVPTPKQVATRAAWWTLSAAAGGDVARVRELLLGLSGRPAVSAELPEVLMRVGETCLARWRCEASPPYIDRLGAALARLGMTPQDAMSMLQNGNADLSPGVRGTLPSWLWSMATGRPIALNDTADTWGPDVPGTSSQQWLYRGPKSEEHTLRQFEQLTRQARALPGIMRGLVTLPVPTVTAEPPARTPTPPASDATPGEPADARRVPARSDGPEGGCWVWWKGKRHDVPKGNTYKLIAHFWARGAAGYDDLDGPVFDGAVEPQTVRSKLSDTNKVLEKIGIPWKLAADSVSRTVTKKHRE
jgi:hypothetical protein